MTNFEIVQNDFTETAEELSLTRFVDAGARDLSSRPRWRQSQSPASRDAAPGSVAGRKTLTVVGTGYVGLVTGACLAQLGHRVVCVDSNEDKITALSNGRIPIYEPGLSEIVEANAATGRIAFSVAPNDHLATTDAIFIAVGTPQSATGHADLAQVFAAASSLRLPADRFVVVIVKSTVPPGTGDEVETRLRANNPDATFEVVSSPEFLREGSAVGDFFEPDRIVVGTESMRARQFMTDLYRPLQLSRGALFFTTRKTAELVKYASNAFLAMKIAFINEMADICEGVGADVDQLAKGMGLDPRIGSMFLRAGPGYGGSCFPKDTMALAALAEAAGHRSQLVETTIRSNEQRKVRMADKVIRACDGSVLHKTIAVLGLTFKAGTDDVREAPSLDILAALHNAGADIRTYDPKGMPSAKQLLPDLYYAVDALDAVTGADAVVVMTEWPEFAALDLGLMKSLMRGLTIVDLRNVYRGTDAEDFGLELTNIGRSETT